MSRTNSDASSGASRERQLPMNECFQPITPSLGTISEPWLQQQQRRRFLIPIRDSDPVISTAISTRGWLVSATPLTIRLYDLNGNKHAQEIKWRSESPINLKRKEEKIRAVAISDDLLAVVTQYRLLMYEYGERGTDEIEAPKIDQNGSWAPKSVSILQVESVDTRQSAAAWIAVGGEGVNGVKLFQYSRGECWSAQRDYRTTLWCPANTSSLRMVGFSQFVRMNRFYVFAVTSNDRIFCWHMFSRESATPKILSDWKLYDGPRQDAASRKGEIASVAIFESPSQRPYIFCAMNQRIGSQMRQSFIAPLRNVTYGSNVPEPGWEGLPDEATGRSVYAAATTSNGRYIAMVKEGSMRLLTLRGAYEGGLTCLRRSLEWSSSLQSTAKDVSGISLMVRENQPGLEIIAVDGRGHVLSIPIRVPDMPGSEPPRLTRRVSFIPTELHSRPVVRELDTRPLMRHRTDTGTGLEQLVDEIEELISETSSRGS